MWPWEHLVFGYLAYSGYTRLVNRRTPEGGPVLVLAFMTQFPDLVDKPLAWTFDVLPSGVSLAHSLLFAIPALVLTAVLSRRLGRPELWPAIAIGYGSHLLGDVLYPVLLGLGSAPSYLLWPLVPQAPDAPTTFLLQFERLLGLFVAFLGTPRGVVYLTLEVAVVLGTLVLWHRDGLPGVAVLVGRLTGLKQPDS
jgi:hypothetical protein